MQKMKLGTNVLKKKKKRMPVIPIIEVPIGKDIHVVMTIDILSKKRTIIVEKEEG
jgi:hypothetical protein